MHIHLDISKLMWYCLLMRWEAFYEYYSSMENLDLLQIVKR